MRIWLMSLKKEGHYSVLILELAHNFYFFLSSARMPVWLLLDSCIIFGRYFFGQELKSQRIWIEGLNSRTIWFNAYWRFGDIDLSVKILSWIFLGFFSGSIICCNILQRCLATGHGMFSCIGKSVLTQNRAPGSAVV